LFGALVNIALPAALAAVYFAEPKLIDMFG